VHPGLYYSDIGNHLGEFAFARETPYVHLKKSRAELERLVRTSEPDRMDRSGHVATPDEWTEIWHSPWMLALIVAALGLEWTLRRQWGLK